MEGCSCGCTACTLARAGIAGGGHCKIKSAGCDV